MDAREYRATAGLEATRKVAAMAETKWSYMKHILSGHKRPGVDLARRLIAASEKVTPDKVMTLDALLKPSEELKR